MNLKDKFQNLSSTLSSSERFQIERLHQNVKEALLADQQKLENALIDIVKHLRSKGVDDQTIMDVSVRMSAYMVIDRGEVFGDWQNEPAN